jgi:hypothetical protein
MQIFKGFSWCVPSSFQNAVETCCFCVGDILYSDLAAYQCRWKEAVLRLRWSLQVKKATAATVAHGETSFDANWSRGRVLVERTDYLAGRCVSRLIETTQGKVYHTLVTGDPTVLESEDSLTVQRIDKGLVDLDAVAVPEELEIARIEALALPAMPVPERVSAGTTAGLVQGLLF